MPIYEYQCKSCDQRFEKLIRSATEADHVACPECGSKKTERALSVFAVGAEAPKRSSRPGGCGRCGGDGPCPLE